MIHIENINTFYKNQKEVAQALNLVIDAYWDKEIDEKTMINTVRNIVMNNYSKIFKGSNYTSTIKQRCGKKRLEVIDKIIKE